MREEDWDPDVAAAGGRWLLLALVLVVLLIGVSVAVFVVMVGDDPHRLIPPLHGV